MIPEDVTVVVLPPNVAPKEKLPPATNIIISTIAIIRIGLLVDDIIKGVIITDIIFLDSTYIFKFSKDNNNNYHFYIGILKIKKQRLI